MTHSQFENLITRFGAAVDNWPANLREAALDLLRASTEAQDLFAQATTDAFRNEIIFQYDPPGGRLAL